MLKTFFSDFANFGDALNKILVERLSNRVVRHASPFTAELMAVGSIFYGGGFFWGPKGHLFSKDRLRYTWRRIRDTFQPTLSVWGSGMLFDEPTPENCVHYRKMNICAVRGKETVRILKRAGFLSSNEPALGDPGLLYPHLMPEVFNRDKIYDLAIVPHYLDFEIGKKLSDDLMSQGYNVKIVDVMQSDPLNVIREIASAKKVASASLHGLIVSDSLGIPNRHLVLSDYEVDRHYGKGAFMLKFNDYYSAFNKEPLAYLTVSDFANDPKATIDSITSTFASADLIKNVKLTLMDSFPEQFRGKGFEMLRKEVSQR